MCIRDSISTLYKLPNNKLKWEKTNSYNIAIDWAFWNNRIYGSLDVYYKKGVEMCIRDRLKKAISTAPEADRSHYDLLIYRINKATEIE